MKEGAHGFIWLYEVKFPSPRKQVGKCRFYAQNGLMTEAKSLSIMKHKDDTHCYLLYEFVNGVNDSYLESVEEAKQEALEQFGVGPEEWEELIELNA